MARTGMLIRRPAAEGFEALIDPEQTSKCWFTRGSGRLEPGKKVQWDWAMYDVSVQVMSWLSSETGASSSNGAATNGPATAGLPQVDWVLEPVQDATTFVRVTESGFTGTGDELVKYVADSTQSSPPMPG